MAHRAKHRQAALARRVEAGRTIKSDLGEDGKPNSAYAAIKRSVAAKKGARTRAAKKVSHVHV